MITLESLRKMRYSPEVIPELKVVTRFNRLEVPENLLVVGDFLKGIPAKELAIKHGMSVSKVYTLLKDADVYVKSKGRISKDVSDNIIRQCRSGTTAKKVARDNAVSATYVGRLMKKHKN